MSETQDQAPVQEIATELKDFKFRFRKDDLGNQRPTVELQLPVPSVEGVKQILENGGKELELLKDVLYEAIRKSALSIVNDNETISKENFPTAQVLWETISNQSRAERKSIDPQLWEDFVKDYMEVMPAVSGKDATQLQTATIVYLKKFSNIKTAKDAISMLKDQLGIYMEHSQKAEQFTEILELLIAKADMYLEADDVKMLVSNL